MTDVPPRLYKYMPPERASSVLGKLLIRFSQVSVMNDIEEFKPPISGMADEQMLQRKVLERTEETHPGFMDLNVNPAENADYVFRNPSVIAELKCIERNAFTAQDGAKLNKLAAKWMDLGLISRFFGARQLRLRELPAPCQRDLLKVLQAPWKHKLGKANNQIRDTKIALRMPNAYGILLLVSDAGSWVAPYDAFSLITRVLQSRKEDGQHVFSHLDCIVYFSVNARVIQDGIGWNFWHPGYRTLDEPIIREFVDRLRDAWFEYHSSLLGMDAAAFQVAP